MSGWLLGGRLAFALCLAAAIGSACGSKGSTMSTPAPTESTQPAATPTAMPTPAASPPPAAEIGAMQLGEKGHATGVNSREWISVVVEVPGSAIGVSGELVLPTDAGPGVAPPPELPCRNIGDPEATGFCFHQFDVPLQVVSDERILGYRVFFGSGGPFIPVSYLFSNGGAVELLSMQYLINLFNQQNLRAIDSIVIGSSVFAGLFSFGAGPNPGQMPRFWTSPDGASTDPLPAEGFTQGPRPTGIDENARIAGAGIDPELPVVWLPADGYTLTHLPTLTSGGRGGALAIDTSTLAGWSADSAGESRAVVWRSSSDGLIVSQLPVSGTIASCARAVAIDGGRVAGECSDTRGTAVGVVWRLEPGAWVEAILEPLSGDDQAGVVAISGDLVVGRSGSEAKPRPVAWRLAAE